MPLSVGTLMNPPVSLMKRFFLFFFLSTALGHAGDVQYDLEIAEQRWSPHDGLRLFRALTVNGGIPGPVLHFRGGDVAHD